MSNTIKFQCHIQISSKKLLDKVKGKTLSFMGNSKTIDKNGEVIFTFPNNTNQFEFEVSDERFYKKAKNNVVRATNNYNDANNTISLNLLSKLRLYFNGKRSI